MRKIISILFLVMASYAFGQVTIKVKEGKKSKMFLAQGEWFFKQNLPDGHYIAYDEYDKSFIAKEVFIKNKKYEGLESRYFSTSTQKYAEINWRNGVKHGTETHYNGNGTINYILNFKDGVLDGPFIINWTEGEKHYDGFYKNGFCDSIWNYYKHSSSIKNLDTCWVSSQYRYQNGKEILWTAFTRQGLQVIKNGNGVFKDSSYYTTTTTYLNGLKNGKKIITKHNGFPYSEEYYKDDLLLKAISYYDSNKVASIDEWSYPYPPQIDTSDAWADDYITDDFYRQINYRYKPIPNGHSLAYFSNGIKNYEGNYNNGQRIGTWVWNYLNNQPRIKVNYETNTFQHFDTTGKIISSFANEYLTPLTHAYWFSTQNLADKIVTLSRHNTKTVTPKFIFHYRGMLEINDYLECGKDISQTINSYQLLANILTLHVTNPKTNQPISYTYKIISATDDEIILETQKQ